MQSISVYIHIPFCQHRCGYCDFNTYAGISDLLPAYSQSVCREIELMAAYGTERLPICSIYFGGGTPSLLPIDQFERIITTLRKQFQLLPSLEVTIEANPGTVTKDYLRQLNSLGVNRISLGMQSALQTELALLERQHSFEDVIKSVEWARSAGINNLNLDLIFGLLFQDINSWMASVKAALALKPEHLSLYALTLEADTPMQLKVMAGILPGPNPDLAADMYEAADESLFEAGYQQYEISNWARLKENGNIYSCEHNLQYWYSRPYLGLGAGAHGFIDHKRTINIASPGAYIKRMNSDPKHFMGMESFPRTPATVKLIPIDVETEIGETMIMGLRLVSEGISDQVFYDRFGIRLGAKFGPQIERLNNFGLLEWADPDRLRLTKKGRLLGNQVFKEFI